MEPRFGFIKSITVIRKASQKADTSMLKLEMLSIDPFFTRSLHPFFILVGKCHYNAFLGRYCGRHRDRAMAWRAEHPVSA